MTTEILGFKLISGEEVIAKAEDKADDGWIVHKPMVLQQVMTPEGVQTVLVPWVKLFLIEETEFTGDQVMAIGTPPEQIVAAYRHVTGDIIVPPKPSLVLAR